MRATGIIRRIDDLGRVVIPKEVRRALSIRENEALEIYTEGRDTVCFRKREASLSDEIDHLREQIEIDCDLPYEIQARIAILLGEVRELVEGEE